MDHLMGEASQAPQEVHAQCFAKPVMQEVKDILLGECRTL